MLGDNKFTQKAIPLIKELMGCFLAFYTDKEKFKTITATTSQPRNPTENNYAIRNMIFEQAGFTFSEISSYLTSVNGVSSISDTQQVFNLMVSKNIISIGNQLINDIHTLNPDFGLSPGNRYKITNEGLLLAMHGLTENSILGIPHIIEKYRHAIIQY